jgi:hypothetical protein
VSKLKKKQGFFLANARSRSVGLAFKLSRNAKRRKEHTKG